MNPTEKALNVALNATYDALDRPPKLEEMPLHDQLVECREEGRFIRPNGPRPPRKEINRND